MRRSKTINTLKAIALASAAALISLYAQPPRTALAQSAADHYHKSLEYQQDNANLSAALDEMKQAVQKDPETAAYRTALGELYFKLNDCTSAIPEMKKAIQLDQNMFTAHTILATCLTFNGRPNEALTEYDTALTLNVADQNDTALIYDRMGYIKHNQGKKDEAEALYLKSIATAPSSIDAYKHLGRLYYEENRTSEALMICQKAVQAAPADADARYNLSFIYAKQGNYDEALKWMDSALELTPTDPGFMESRKQLAAWAEKPKVHETGELKGLPTEIVKKTPINEIYGLEPEQKQPEQKTAVAEKPTPQTTTPQPQQTTTTKQPEKQTPPPQQQVVVAQQPVQQQTTQPQQTTQQQPAKQQTQPQQTTVQQPEPQKQQPEKKETKEKKEKSKREKKQKPEATAEQKQEKPEKQRKKEPSREELAAEFFKAAKYNIATGQIKDAKLDAAHALELFPDNPDYLTANALALIQAGDTETALEQLNLALKQNPAHSAALNTRGYAQYILGHADSAEGDFNNALASDPMNGCASANAAAILASRIECGDKTSAAVISAIENRCLRAQLQNNMAICFLANGDAERAKNYTFRALKSSPKDRAIKTNYSYLVKKTGSQVEKLVLKESTPEPYYNAAASAGDIPLASLTPIVTLDIVKTFNANWKPKRMLVMPFENPRGTRKWRRSPSETYTDKIVETLSSPGYLIIVHPDAHPEYSYEDLKDPDTLAKLAKKYKADLIFAGKLSRPTLTRTTESKLLGLKKKDTLQASLVLDTIVYEASTSAPILKGAIEGVSNIPGIDDGELTYFQSVELGNKAFTDYGSKTTNAILDYYNLISYPVDDQIVRLLPGEYEYQKTYHW